MGHLETGWDEKRLEALDDALRFSARANGWIFLDFDEEQPNRVWRWLRKLDWAVPQGMHWLVAATWKHYGSAVCVTARREYGEDLDIDVFTQEELDELLIRYLQAEGVIA